MAESSRRTAKNPFVSVSPLAAAVLMHNLMTRPEKDESASMVLNEILRELNAFRYTYKREVIETALYCCNLNDEEGVFWHPTNIPFKSFAYDLALANKTKFDYYYNQLKDMPRG